MEARVKGEQVNLEINFKFTKLGVTGNEWVSQDRMSEWRDY